MTPRPLHRWKSFWLGVLVLTFLAWGWVRSIRQTEGFFWMPRHFIVTAGQSSSTVSLNWDGSRRPAAPIALMKWIQEPASTTGEPRFPKAVNWETYDRQIQVTVAHWFLILVFLLPWTAFLLWRHRRMKRFAVTAGSTEET